MRNCSIDVWTDDMTARRDVGRRETPGDPDQPYEHPALEPEVGYWAERWAEFKRLLYAGWNNGYTKETVILCAIAWVVFAFGAYFLGWR